MLRLENEAAVKLSDGRWLMPSGTRTGMVLEAPDATKLFPFPLRSSQWSTAWVETSRRTDEALSAMTHTVAFAVGFKG